MNTVLDVVRKYLCCEVLEAYYDIPMKAYYYHVVDQDGTEYQISLYTRPFVGFFMDYWGWGHRQLFMSHTNKDKVYIKGIENMKIICDFNIKNNEEDEIETISMEYDKDGKHVIRFLNPIFNKRYEKKLYK